MTRTYTQLQDGCDGGSRAEGAPPSADRRRRQDFGGFPAVNHVNLDVRKGEIFALLGRRLRQEHAAAHAGGFRDAHQWPHRAQRQDLPAMPPYDGPLNMMFPELRVPPPDGGGQHRLRPETRRHAARRRSTSASHARPGVAGKYAPQPHQLSGGTAVACARAQPGWQPQLPLLDEPCAGQKLREETQIELVNIIERGVTCVMVTHDQEEAMTMASRIAVMSEGRSRRWARREIYEFPPRASWPTSSATST